MPTSQRRTGWQTPKCWTRFFTFSNALFLSASVQLDPRRIGATNAGVATPPALTTVPSALFSSLEALAPLSLAHSFLLFILTPWRWRGRGSSPPLESILLENFYADKPLPPPTHPAFLNANPLSPRDATLIWVYSSQPGLPRLDAPHYLLTTDKLLLQLRKDHFFLFTFLYRIFQVMENLFFSSSKHYAAPIPLWCIRI